MNMLNHPDRRTASPLEQETRSQLYYDVTIRVAVDDPALLWRRAAAHLLAFAGLDEVALEETIGPREDPAVADCLAVLFGPVTIEGVRYEMFAVRPAHSGLKARMAG